MNVASSNILELDTALTEGEEKIGDLRQAGMKNLAPVTTNYYHQVHITDRGHDERFFCTKVGNQLSFGQIFSG